jgi:hypothetical protein
MGHDRDIAQFAPILLNAIIQSAESTAHICFQILQGLDKPLREKVGADSNATSLY